MGDRTPLPDFELPATGNPRFELSAFKGHPVLALDFHPRDNTPGVTVSGISRDSPKSHGISFT
jgi:peroxiredoxin